MISAILTGIFLIMLFCVVGGILCWGIVYFYRADSNLENAVFFVTFTCFLVVYVYQCYVAFDPFNKEYLVGL